MHHTWIREHIFLVTKVPEQSVEARDAERGGGGNGVGIEDFATVDGVGREDSVDVAVPRGTELYGGSHLAADLVGFAAAMAPHGW